MRILPALFVLALLPAVPRDAEACSAVGLDTPVVIPREGATGVPTLVDVVVIAGRTPAVSLATSAGVAVPIGPASAIGFGYDSVKNAHGTFYRARVNGELAANTAHVITVDGAERGRFTTGAGYGKQAGVAPVSKAVSLTRVRYPVSEIASGNCVFSEYVGFASLDWSLGTFPDTPVDSIVHVLSLTPQVGGSPESFLWVGTTPFAGTAATGAHPDPVGFWQPPLDASLNWCFSVEAYAYGEAVLPTRGDRVCASVAQLSAPGAPTDGTASGGCAVTSRGGATRGFVLGLGAVVVAVSLRRPRARRALKSK